MKMRCYFLLNIKQIRGLTTL